MCFDESNGDLLWQLVVPKRSEDPYFDWPKSGISSPATVEGDRVYIVSNRGEVICLDANGLADGNDGPFKEEGWHMSPPAHANLPPKAVQGAPILPEQLEPGPATGLLKPGPLDADIIWVFDMVEGAGIWPHDGAHSSILIRGDHIYLNTGTGVDNTHKAILTPDAPSLIVLDKHSGRYLAREREGIAPNIFHCTWSAPSMARINGRDQIIFAAGNGVVYGFEPIENNSDEHGVQTLKKIWWFDIDPTAPKTNVHSFHGNKREGPSNVFGLPVVYDNRVYVAGGGDLWWGKNECWLKCFDPAGTGDISRSRLLWTAELGRHVFSSPAVVGDLVFQADNSRFIYCFDANTGELHWKHETKGDFWASPYVVDRKVFLGTRRGDFWVFAASKEKKLLSQIDLGAPISATAVAANGTLYVATMFDLFAVSAIEE
jgi:outer membrane protein assembly factor BamB